MRAEDDTLLVESQGIRDQLSNLIDTEATNLTVSHIGLPQGVLWLDKLCRVDVKFEQKLAKLKQADGRHWTHPVCDWDVREVTFSLLSFLIAKGQKKADGKEAAGKWLLHDIKNAVGVWNQLLGYALMHAKGSQHHAVRGFMLADRYTNDPETAKREAEKIVPAPKQLPFRPLAKRRRKVVQKRLLYDWPIIPRRKNVQSGEYPLRLHGKQPLFGGKMLALKTGLKVYANDNSEFVIDKLLPKLAKGLASQWGEAFAPQLVTDLQHELTVTIKPGDTQLEPGEVIAYGHFQKTYGRDDEVTQGMAKRFRASLKAEKDNQ